MRGVDDGQQVVDLEGQVVGQAVDVVAAALVEQQFQQAGHAARPRVGQHLVVHLALVAHPRCRLLVGRLGGRHIGLGQHLVDVVHQLRKRLRLAVARLRQAAP